MTDYPPPRLVQYVHWCVLHARSMRYQGWWRAVWRAKRLQWRIDHLEKLIMQNTPKSDWDSVYGIKNDRR